jgi:hypothetical protein
MGCDRSETIDIQSLHAAFGVAESLSDQVVCDVTCVSRRDSGKHFDGKSDGKSFLSILLAGFTGRRRARQRESLYLKAYSQWCLTALRESSSYIAGSPTP